MADPLSTAGTAVGIVSLGLQVSQGLITYYSQFKAYADDIAYLVQKIESLQSLLQSLEGPLQKAEAGTGDISIQVRNATTACENGLEKLGTALQKYGNLDTPTTRKEKVKALQKRVLYPFKISTLGNLNMTLEQLLGNMHLALKVLLLDISQSHWDKTVALAVTVTSDSQHLKSHLDVKFDTFDNRLNQLISGIQAGQIHSPLYLEPARLAFMCQEQQELYSNFQAPLQAGNGRKRLASEARNGFCSCTQYSQVMEKPASSFGMSWSRSLRHRPDCPLSQFAQHRIDTLGAKFMFCTKVLRFAVATSLSVAHGAGGFAINPHFMLRAVVSKDSPAFQLLQLDQERVLKRETTDYVFRANWLLQELATLFRDGKASPTDVLPDGQTLLRSAIRLIYFWNTSEKVGNKCAMEGVSRLLDGLLSFGTDPLARDRYNRTILSYATQGISGAIAAREHLASDDASAGILVKLFNCDLAVENSPLIRFGNSRIEFALVHKALHHLTEVERLGTFDVSAIQKAIWFQDEGALRDAIKSFPESINQRFDYGQTPLHLSVLWPAGLTILLDNKAETSTCDNLCDTALFYACRFEQGPSISLLLEHDSPMGCGMYANECLRYASNWKDLALQGTFVRHLVNRRTLLLQLALDRLPGFKLGMLNLRADRILDAQAACVTTALLEHGVEIASALASTAKPFKTTVYHTYRLSLQMAMALWEAGFRDVDEIDTAGRTPFWTQIFNSTRANPDFDVLKWLKDRGVDVYNKNIHGGGMAIHAVGAAIGRITVRAYTGNLLKPRTTLEAGLFLADDVQDDCRCACSKNGCRVVTSAVKRRTKNLYRYTRQMPGNIAAIRSRSYGVVLRCIEVHIDENPWMSLEVIRVLTFEWLELTHTCHEDPEHSYDWCRGPLPPEEIDEIHHEERILLQKHEELVAEFEAMYIELGIPLATFLEDHWKPRMEEVLKERDDSGLKEERRKMRELGITVEERDRFEELSDDYDDDDDNEDEGEQSEDEEGGEEEVQEEAAEQDSDTEDFRDCEDTPAVS